MVLTSGDDKAYEIMPLTAEDAGLVGGVFRAAYGDGYPYTEVYQPEKLRSELREGRLIAFLAVDPAGRPVGYFAQAKTAPNPRLWEEKGLAVAPEYGHTQLALALVSRVRGSILPAHDGIFSTAVCHHYFSQVVCAKGGRSDCALGLDQLEGNVFRERAAAAGRVALLLNFSEHSAPPAPVYLPPEYAVILRRLAKPLRPRVFRPADAPLPVSGLTVRVDSYYESARTWTVSVRKVGADWPAVLEKLLLQAARRGVISLQVTINADRPSLGAAIALMRRRGFFFGGLAPRWFGTDGVMLQKVLGKDPDYDGIRLYTTTARELLAFIRADRDAANLLAAAK